MAYIPRLGMREFSVAAGQSLVVGSFGDGTTRISNASGPLNTQIPATFSQYAVVNGGSVYLTFANAQSIRIEASPGCDVEYDYGAQPSLSFMPFSATTGLTAKAGGGQSGATALTGNINRVTAVATAGDSAILPAAVAGRTVSVFNASANSLNVFPQTGESIGTGAANAAFAVAGGKGALFLASSAGVWNPNLSA